MSNYNKKKIKKIVNRNTEEMLIKERNFISAILETTGALVVIFDTQGRFIRINDTFEKTTGFSIMDIVGKTFWDVLLMHEEIEPIKSVFKEILSGKHTLEYQSKIITRNGNYRSIVWSITALKRDDKHFEYIIASGIDITEIMHVKELLNEANQNLLHSERKFRSLVSNIPGSIYRSKSKDRDSIEFLNSEIEKITGYPASDFYQDRKRTFSSIIHPEDLGNVLNTIKEGVVKREPFIIEYRIIHSDGSIRWVYEKGQCVFEKKGKLLWLDGVIFDITERKKLEKEREKIIKELQDAITKVRTLSGLLPICSSCKKIRDDKGYWNQIEEYIKKHSEAEFSHSLCPDCVKKLYPEFYKKNMKVKAI